jgi:hypothetical protein
VPQGPPAGVPAGPKVPKGEAPGEARAAKGRQVVVCKYVRTPGAAEIFSHIIVVNENALEGRGFAGTFPFAFSDAHFNSVAVRFAAKGEQAREIDTAVCGADVPEEPPGVPPVDGSGDVGGVSEERDVPGDVSGDVRGAAADGDAEVALPNTGAPLHLQLLAVLGGLCSIAGIWLVMRTRRGGHLPS